MVCVVCGRGSTARLRVKLARLPSKTTCALCDDCAKDDMRIAEAERRVKAGAA
jgi:hypothetical protein